MPPLTQSSSSEIVCLTPLPSPGLPPYPGPLGRPAKRAMRSPSPPYLPSSSAAPSALPRARSGVWPTTRPRPPPRPSASASASAFPSPFSASQLSQPSTQSHTTSTRTATTTSRPLTASDASGPSTRPLASHELAHESAGYRMTPGAEPAGARRRRADEAERERERLRGLSRARVTERMLNTRGMDINPITNSDLYSLTDHFVSSATGHQQSNRGGGSAGASSYWAVRTAKVEEGAREKETDVLAGCVIAINGSTGPRVSNLQLQRLITAHGGRFVPHQTAACTHVVAANLSGRKAQKVIDGLGARGHSRRTQVVKVDWVLDSVAQQRRGCERKYAVVEDPTSLASAFAKQAGAKLY